MQPKDNGEGLSFIFRQTKQNTFTPRSQNCHPGVLSSSLPPLAGRSLTSSKHIQTTTDWQQSLEVDDISTAYTSYSSNSQKCQYPPIPLETISNSVMQKMPKRNGKGEIPLSRRPDCMHFLRGSCANGENCLYRHNLLARVGGMNVCDTWLRDHACSDQLCKKIHTKNYRSDLDEKLVNSAKRIVIAPVREKELKPPILSQSTLFPSSASSTPTLKPFFAKKPDCMFFVRGHCNKGNRCPFRHNTFAREGSLEVCKMWERKGECSDALCRHLHPRTIHHSHSANTIVANESLPLRPDCIFFMKGRCTKGESCIFRHNEKAREGNGELCENWKTKGRCGDPECSFLHPKHIETICYVPHKGERIEQKENEMQREEEEEIQFSDIKFIPTKSCFHYGLRYVYHWVCDKLRQKGKAINLSSSTHFDGFKDANKFSDWFKSLMYV
jgi:hypothetical protein